MSSESIVSRPLHFFDVPEVTSLTAGFSYNFFVADEKINESGNDCNLAASLGVRLLSRVGWIGKALLPGTIVGETFSRCKRT